MSVIPPLNENQGPSHLHGHGPKNEGITSIRKGFIVWDSLSTLRMVVVGLGMWMRMRMMLLMSMLLDVNHARLVELPFLVFQTVTVLGTICVREFNIHGVPMLIELLGEPKDAQRLLRQ